MKNTTIALLSLVVTVSAQPDDLIRVRATYQKKIEETTKTYVDWLQKRVSETSGEVSVQYLEELKNFKSDATSSTKPNVVQEKTEGLLKGKTITIDAQTGFVKLGNFKVGETIRLQYSSGTWTAHSDFEKESPDNPVKNFHGVTLTCKDYDSTILVTKPIRNTLDNVFEHTVAEGEVGEYFLSMNIPTEKRPLSSGSAKYKMEVTK